MTRLGGTDKSGRRVRATRLRTVPVPTKPVQRFNGNMQDMAHMLIPCSCATDVAGADARTTAHTNTHATTCANTCADAPTCATTPGTPPARIHANARASTLANTNDNNRANPKPTPVPLPTTSTRTNTVPTIAPTLGCLCDTAGAPLVRRSRAPQGPLGRRSVLIVDNQGILQSVPKMAADAATKCANIANRITLRRTAL